MSAETLRFVAELMRAEAANPVALAMADLLDVAAAHVGSHDCEAHCEPDGCPQALAALAAARAYLGEQP